MSIGRTVVVIALGYLAACCRQEARPSGSFRPASIVSALQRELGPEWSVSATNDMSPNGWVFRGQNTNMMWYSEKLDMQCPAMFHFYLHPIDRPEGLAKIMYPSGNIEGYPFGQTRTHFVCGNAYGPGIEDAKVAIRRAFALVPREEHVPWPTDLNK